MTAAISDIIGIGFGPANIALAAALEERDSPHSAVFLERNAEPCWQPGMMLSGSDIQNNPLRDLVTPRNPRSRYSFTNYLHEHGRLFAYLNLGIAYPLRKDYAQYVTWVARHFDRSVRYSRDVVDIAVTGRGATFTVTMRDGETVEGRSIVAAPGRTPLIPAPFADQRSDRIFHLTRYLPGLAHLQRRHGPVRRLCVIGGSQSAVELLLDVSARCPDAQITGIQRGYGFALKDTSPFSDHVYFPEHVDYYFNASKSSKAALDQQLRRTNYSAADADVIEKLYLQLYEQRLDGEERVRVIGNTAVTAVTEDADGLSLSLEEVHRGDRSLYRTDAVILATGFCNFGAGPMQERMPGLLAAIGERLAVDRDGVLDVARDYRLTPAHPDIRLPPLYLNGLCEASHGMGDAGSFSLLSLRSDLIARSLDMALREGHGGSTLPG